MLLHHPAWVPLQAPTTATTALLPCICRSHQSCSGTCCTPNPFSWEPGRRQRRGQPVPAQAEGAMRTKREPNPAARRPDGQGPPPLVRLPIDPRSGPARMGWLPQGHWHRQPMCWARIPLALSPRRLLDQHGLGACPTTCSAFLSSAAWRSRRLAEPRPERTSRHAVSRCDQGASIGAWARA